MMNSYIVLTVLSLFSFSAVAEQVNKQVNQLANQNEEQFVVTTVNDSGVAIRVDSVQWWVKGKRDKKFVFQCTDELCSRWVINRVSLKEDMVVYAAASVVRKEDNACWDLYAGERLLNDEIRNNKMKSIQIVLYFTGTVCS